MLYTPVGMVGEYLLVYMPGWVWWVLPGIYARVGMVGIPLPYYTRTIPPWVYHPPALHPGPAHPAAHGVRVC